MKKRNEVDKLFDKLFNTKIIKKGYVLTRLKKGNMPVKVTVNQNPAVLLNTALYSHNAGDYIIEDYCKNTLKEIGISNIIDIPTHKAPGNSSMKDIQAEMLKFMAGTNILDSKMEASRQWRLPVRSEKLVNICLLGVGWNSYQGKISNYTEFFLKSVLTNKYLHSVRDSYTEQKLREIGITNVLNTSCVTMWNLTPEHCEKIPTKKGENVITTITDYSKDFEKDNIMFKVLLENYKSVYVWLQGVEDKAYLEQIVDISKINLIEGNLKEYDSVLQSKNNNFDYVGTRLHAGIRALNIGARTIIIAIDNRAKEIAKDTNLMIVDRNEVEYKLSLLINSEFNTEIRLPRENILQWKQQFKN